MLIETKFSVGDVVWLATTTRVTKQHPCPDCLGTKKWKAISPAGTEYTFRCPRCGQNYHGDHKLRLDYSQFAPATRRLTIGSVQTDSHSDEGHRYMAYETGVGSGNIWREANLFATEQEALAAAEVMANEQNSGGVPWVKEQYDETLELSDYQLADGRERVGQLSLTKLSYKFSDTLTDIENCESLDEVKEIVKNVRES